MVQGLPAIDWKKADNNAKLFAAVLALFPGTPDHKKIATAFGESALVLVSFEFNMNLITWPQIPQHQWCQDHVDG